MRSPLFWVITQRVVVISYRRFGTTYRSHLQGSSKLPAFYRIRTFIAWCTGICRESVKSNPLPLHAISFRLILRLSFRFFIGATVALSLQPYKIYLIFVFSGCVLNFSPISPSWLNEPKIFGVKSTRCRASNFVTACAQCWYIRGILP